MGTHKQAQLDKQDAARIKAATAKTKKPSWQKEFISVYLDKHHKERVKALLKEPTPQMLDIARLIDDGFKLTISPHKTKGAMAMITPQEPDHRLYGYAVSAFAPDGYSAFLVLMYKHLYVLSEDWIEESMGEDDSDFG